MYSQFDLTEGGTRQGIRSNYDWSGTSATSVPSYEQAQQVQQGIAGISPQTYGSKLMQMMQGGFTPDDPSYAWRFQQGQQAVERSAAARGLMGSGNAAIELQQYGQGMASQEYGNQWSRLAQMALGTYGIAAGEGQQSQRLLFEKQQASGRASGLEAAMSNLQRMYDGTQSSSPQMQSSDPYQGQTNAYPGGTAPIDLYSAYSSPSYDTGGGEGYWSSSSGGSGTLGGGSPYYGGYDYGGGGGYDYGAVDNGGWDVG